MLDDMWIYAFLALRTGFPVCLNWKNCISGLSTAGCLNIFLYEDIFTSFKSYSSKAMVMAASLPSLFTVSCFTFNTAFTFFLSDSL